MSLHASKVDANARWNAAMHEQVTVSCEMGCIWCCYHLVTCAGFEADLIREKAPPFMVQRAIEMGREQTCDASQWFARRQPCAFLDGSTCAIYGYRPTVCATLWAASPVEHCGLGSRVHFLRVDNTDPIAFTAALERTTPGVFRWGLLGQLLG